MSFHSVVELAAITQGQLKAIQHTSLISIAFVSQPVMLPKNMHTTPIVEKIIVRKDKPTMAMIR